MLVAVAYSCQERCGQRSRGVFEAADSFMARWYRDDAEGSCQHVAGDAKSGVKEWG